MWDHIEDQQSGFVLKLLNIGFKYGTIDRIINMSREVTRFKHVESYK
jgi:hypothetical protein